VYYEIPNGSGIWIDWMVVEISDGSNWYTVFYWGNNIADTNSNMNFNAPLTITIPDPQEVDQRDIASIDLYPFNPVTPPYNTGIAIDVDAIVPAGTYSYIRFYAPPGDADGQAEIDAIQILP
jgi:hypothetical protein